jgi:hypothetical protein
MEKKNNMSTSFKFKSDESLSDKLKIIEMDMK